MINLMTVDLVRDCPYMTSDGRGGGSAKSDFISKAVLIKHLMRGGGRVKKRQKSSDVIYGRPHILFYLQSLIHIITEVLF